MFSSIFNFIIGLVSDTGNAIYDFIISLTRR